MTGTDVLTVASKLEIPINKLYMLSNNRKSRQKHGNSKYENYHTVVIQSSRGHKKRVLSVSNNLLKIVQRRILDCFLYQLETSEYSTAYCKGKSLLDNASPHIGKECVLKLDISHFFDSITDDSVYLAFKQFGLSVSATSLLTHLCTYNGKLPQGAPTSPYIANLIMKRFDEKLGKWCKERNITYTRYCDDMTFSGDRTTVRKCNIITKVRALLNNMEMKLNDKKTIFISSSQQQRVTGIVVNEKATIPCEMRRSIRQEVYFCTKFGVSDSLQRQGLDISPDKYLHSLLGRISFALQIDPDNNEIKRYFVAVKGILSTQENGIA